MNNLIINTGPLGDVLRTTVLLRSLEGEKSWITRSRCAEILYSSELKRVYCLESKKDLEDLTATQFDLTVSLNEEPVALDLLNKIRTKKLIGIYTDKTNGIKYTPESETWFDMSLSSRFGKTMADKLKMANRKSHPQMMVEMIGGEWNQQEYDLGVASIENCRKIGLINVVTGNWPNKQWAHYEDLKQLLDEEGYETEFLGIKPRIKEHIEDINRCGLVVCGDTFGMHVALALKKKVVAMFTCTSPHEIESYGRLKKIVSSKYEEFFYSKIFDPRAIDAIPIEDVYRAIKSFLD